QPLGHLTRVSTALVCRGAHFTQRFSERQMFFQRIHRLKDVEGKPGRPALLNWRLPSKGECDGELGHLLLRGGQLWRHRRDLAPGPPARRRAWPGG
ncbi:hypothetical protein C1T30_42855, partial [Bacillus sp. MBGLi97]